ncbi:MAG: hypothetical protein NT137_06275 [Methanomassiliicoccales archaeon]|nr:hypothetical protein [Methanomassiliicoccales archaeon]
MQSAREGLWQARSRELWIPITLIVIGAALELLQFFFLLYTYLSHWTHVSFPSLSLEAGYLFLALGPLGLPLLALGAALFLFMNLKAQSGVATWSRRLLVAGALLMVVGGGVLSAYYVATYQYLASHHVFSSEMYQWGALGGMLNVLGIVSTMVASVLLIRCFRRGVLSIAK